jgi:hypothetical protein
LIRRELARIRSTGDRSRQAWARRRSVIGVVERPRRGGWTGGSGVGTTVYAGLTSGRSTAGAAGGGGGGGGLHGACSFGDEK